MRRLAKIVGWTLVTLDMLALYGWMQANDPDCYLSTEVLAQLRLCDAYGSAQSSPTLVRLLLIALLMGLAIVCLRYAARTPAEKETATAETSASTPSQSAPVRDS